MTSKPTGGPAFPIPGLCEDEDFNGMTLRDYFASKAMQSIFAGEAARMVANVDERYDETNWAEVVAANAYEMADAMLKARDA